MAYYVLVGLVDGRPTFLLGDDDWPQDFDTKEDAEAAAMRSMLGRAFGFAVLDVPLGDIPMAKVAE